MLKTIFEGVFKPPIIGEEHVPIKITGSGQCEATSDGLRIQGFRQKSKVNSSQLFILFFSLLFGMGLVKGLLQQFAKIEISNYLIIGIPLLACVYPFMQGAGDDHQGELIQLMIPWDRISGVKLDKKLMCVVIPVKKFRYQNERYQGALFFEPSDGAESFLVALRVQGIKC
jgi:hypothetical protein